MFAASVSEALKAAGVPFVSVSIGRKDDKATWRVDFAPTATDADKAQAASVIAAFVPPDPADEEAKFAADTRILRAIVVELHAAIPDHAGKPTLAQLRNRIISRYKALT